MSSTTAIKTSKVQTLRAPDAQPLEKTSAAGVPRASGRPAPGRQAGRGAQAVAARHLGQRSVGRDLPRHGAHPVRMGDYKEAGKSYRS